jgi:hypothetical protein
VAAEAATMTVGDATTHATELKSVCRRHDCTELQEPKKLQERSLETVSFLRSPGVNLSVSHDVTDGNALVSTVLGRWWQSTQSMHDSNTDRTTTTTTITTTRTDTTTNHANHAATDITVARDICGLLLSLYIVQSLVHCTYIVGDSDSASVISVNYCRRLQ